MRNFDRVAKVYDATRGLPPEVMAQVVAAVAAELDGGRTVLDAGVGTGRWASAIQSKHFHVVGLDVSRSMLEIARQRGAQDVVRGAVERMPFPDLTFDSCVMIHILHLVDDPSALLSEVVRVCTSRVVSLVEESDRESVRDEYIKLRSELGRPWKGFSEGDLAERLNPVRRRKAATYRARIEAEDDISYFNDRLSALTWDVPDGMHSEIIRILRAKSRDSPYCTREIEVVSWDVEQLRGFKTAA